MTFMHKLSRRLALLKDATALCALALVASCEKPIPLGPAGPDVTRLIVVPDSTTLEPAQTRQFAAYGRTPAGDSVAIAAIWSAVGGAISASGLYTAASLEGDYVVQATLASPTATQAAASGAAATAAPSGSSVVHVRRTRALVQVFVTPATASLPTGGTQQFAAYGRLNVGDSVAVAVNWSATGGSISAGGLYTAGSTTGAYAVTAKSTGISSTATVTVASAPVATVSIAPSSASLFAGGMLQLVATPLDVSGNPLPGRAVTWSTSNAAAANVSATGLVTALAAGSAMITATSEGQNGTATVDVSNVPVASVVVNPTTASLLVRHCRHHGVERAGGLCKCEPALGKRACRRNASARSRNQGLGGQHAHRPHCDVVEQQHDGGDGELERHPHG